MTYYSRAAWGANPNYRGTSGWPGGMPNSLTVHAVGAGVGQRARPEDYFATLRGIQSHAIGKGLSDFDYNFAVDWLGNVYEGRGWSVQSGAHHVGNKSSLAVVYLDLGDGDVPFTEAAKGAIRWLRDTGCHGGPIYPHRFWNDKGPSKYVTSCPGNEISAWCNAGAPGPGVNPGGPISPEEDDDMYDDAAKKLAGEIHAGVLIAIAEGRERDERLAALEEAVFIPAKGSKPRRNRLAVIVDFLDGGDDDAGILNAIRNRVDAIKAKLGA